ncbi:MAG TPA: GTP-binding protein [Abditibacteriaceae bacterium]
MIPLLSVCGFLGAGKTTLVRRLVEDAARRKVRLAVIVNEFGTTDVDSHILREADAELLASIAGGCACCSGGDELHWTLEELAARPANEKPDIVILETSGLADPVALLETLLAPQLLPHFHIAPLVCVADAARLSLDAPLPLLFQRQIQLAGTIALNKIDRIGETQKASALSRVRGWNKNAYLESTSHAALDLDALWQRTQSTVDFDRTAQATPHSAQTFVLPLSHPVQRSALETALQELPPEVWRAKGFVRVAGEDTLQLLQWTGEGSGNLAPFHLAPFAEEPPLALVFIGESLDIPTLSRAFGTRLLAAF